MKPDVIARAEATKGGSSEAIYKMVARVLSIRHPGGGTLLDIGCGQGELRKHVAPHVSKYIGVDVIRYESFPADAEFYAINLDQGWVPLPDAYADGVVAVETIEHLENPRAFFRELVRLTKPGGLIVVTTPNQLSLLSLITLLAKGQFNAFQEAPGLYPAHISALLEIDLLRIAREAQCKDIQISHSNRGRVPFSSKNWPSLFRGRRFSDNLCLSAVRE